jgi:hypothetical protein
VAISGGNHHSVYHSQSLGDSTDDSQFGSVVANLSNEIQALQSDGFQVGTGGEVNDNGTTYYYLAINRGAGINTNSYVGDNGTARNITGAGFQPTFVFVKDTTTDAMALTTDKFASGNSITSRAINTSLRTDLIKALQTDGFQVGNGAETNASGRTYHYFALASQNGAPRYLTATQADSVNTFSTGISASAWVKYDSVSRNQTIIRKSDSTVGTNSYQLSSNGTNFQFQVGTSTSITILTGTTSIVPNKWYYVSGTYDGASNAMQLYVNGIQEASVSGGGTAGTISTGTTNGLYLGSIENDIGNGFMGRIDDVRIYSRALSAAEIQRLYSLGK